ncbi:hypothetical protein [Rhodopseudomonas palustris]|nr:hypothetical protein [Rhodopseudomonas palustris]
MNLEVGLILGNFGLERSNVQACVLFEKQPDRSLREITWSDLGRIGGHRPLSPIETFRLAFFETGDADGDPDALEQAINPRNWTSEAIIESSFGALLNSFAQFLLALFAANRLPVYGLLRFHTHNFALLEWLSGKPEFSSLYQSAAGVHLSVTREVDAYARAVQEIVDAHTNLLHIRLEADGPLDPSYYESLFREADGGQIRVDWVRPRNSPVEVSLNFFDYATLLSIVALVLATRTKFELSKIQSMGWIASPPTGDRNGEAANGKQLIAFRTGFSLDRPSEYEINVRTLLPRSFLLDLHLCLNISLFKRVRGVLIGLLLPPKDP